MPQTKLAQRNHRFEKIIVLIRGTIDARKIPIAEFTKAVGIPPSTLYRRKKHPEEFTSGELSRIGRYLGLSIDELRQSAIIY